MRIAALVVTYNRMEKFKKCLDALRAQTVHVDIIVVDSASTDGTGVFCKGLKDIGLIGMPENRGPAGGFGEGLRWAAEHGYDYIWGMDDDAFPDCKALEKVLEAAGSLKGPGVLWSNCDNDEDFDSPLKKVDTFTFAGFFVGKEIVETVGVPREDFFIYYDDTEYARRVQAGGYEIYKVRDSIIEHRDWHARGVETVRKGPFRFKFVFTEDWRLYYETRNRLLLYSYAEIQKYTSIYYLLKQYLKILLVAPGQRKIFEKAFLDGLFGRSGKIPV